MTHRSFDDPGSIEARQGLLDNRCERAAPKKHRIRKRSKRLAAKKRSRIAHQLAVQFAKAQRYHAKVRAYWRGDREEHP